MWLSLVFSYADKKYGEEQLFLTIKSAILTYAVAVVISIVLTISTYLLISFIQSCF